MTARPASDKLVSTAARALRDALQERDDLTMATSMNSLAWAMAGLEGVEFIEHHARAQEAAAQQWADSPSTTKLDVSGWVDCEEAATVLLRFLYWWADGLPREGA